MLTHDFRHNSVCALQFDDGTSWLKWPAFSCLVLINKFLFQLKITFVLKELLFYRCHQSWVMLHYPHCSNEHRFVHSFSSHPFSSLSLSFDKFFLIFQATDSDPFLIVAVLTPFTIKPSSVNLLLIICLHDPKT